MKCTGIYLHEGFATKGFSFQAFSASKYAKNLQGQLLIALTEENTWSGEFTVEASFGDKPSLRFNHETFLSERALVIEEHEVLTVAGVREAVLRHLNESMRSLLPGIKMLNDRAAAIRKVIQGIPQNEALAVITEVYPAAHSAEFLSCSSGDLWVFTRPNLEKIFVTRRIDGEFVGAVCLNIQATDWYDIPDGIQPFQKLGLFWLELARRYCAKKYRIPLKSLDFKEFFPVGGRPNGQYDIERIDLWKDNKPPYITVEFKDGLPKTAAWSIPGKT